MRWREYDGIDEKIETCLHFAFRSALASILNDCGNSSNVFLGPLSSREQNSSSFKRRKARARSIKIGLGKS